MGFRSKVSIAALLAGSLIGVAPEALADPTDEALACLPRQVTAKCPSIKTANVADALADNLMDSFHRSRAAIGRGNARVRVVFHAASAVANSEPTWLGLEVVERLHTKIQNRLRAELGRRQTPQQIKALKRANWSANDIRDLEKSMQDHLKAELERADLWRTEARDIVRSPTTWTKTDEGWEFSNDLYSNMRAYWRQENY